MAFTAGALHNCSPRGELPANTRAGEFQMLQRGCCYELK
jgi:hypothetical protein